MTVKDLAMQIHAQIHHLRQVRRELDLTIQALRSLLPDRGADDRRQYFMVNPDNGKKETHDRER